MTRVLGSDDVYRHFVEDADESWLFGLVCFAVLEEQRIEWMEHFTLHNDGQPTPADIRKWYEQLSPGALLRIKGTAENALQNYADDVVQEILEAERREAIKGVIVSEIRSANGPLRQFGINVAGGLVSALVFAGFLVAVYFVAIADVSPIKTVTAISGQSTEEIEDGETTGK